MVLEWFFEWIPRIALAGLAFIILFFVWLLWQNVAPAAPGISLGYYEVLGRYAGKKLLKRLKGPLVDCTSIFINPDVEREFKEMVAEDIKALLPKETDTEKKADLQAIKNQFPMEFSLSNMCRVIAMRHKGLSKHILIQWDHMDKPLNEFAANEPEAKLTLGFGFLSKGVIGGEIDSFPQPWNIHKLGKVHVHLFRPDVPRGTIENLTKEPPKWLARLALFARSSLEFKEERATYKAQLSEKDRKMADMGKELSAMATEVDALRRTLRGFVTTGKLPESVKPKRVDIGDFVTIALPTLIGSIVARFFEVEVLAGVFIGLLVGIALLSRRI